MWDPLHFDVKSAHCGAESNHSDAEYCHPDADSIHSDADSTHSDAKSAHRGAESEHSDADPLSLKLSKFNSYCCLGKFYKSSVRITAATHYLKKCRYCLIFVPKRVVY
jgi:hypothetical protein